MMSKIKKLKEQFQHQFVKEIKIERIDVVNISNVWRKFFILDSLLEFELKNPVNNYNT